jgi:hypothetical protein
MKKYLITIIILMTFSLLIIAQDKQITALNEVKDKVTSTIDSAAVADSKFKNFTDLILNDPSLYNELWGKVYNSLHDKGKENVFKNLKIQFKTFQANDSSKTSLGFAYNWDIYLDRKINSEYERSGFNVHINTSGNIAFKKQYNPSDFQQAKLLFTKYGFWGGTVAAQDSEMIQKLTEISLKLAEINDEKELHDSPLWNELTSAIQIRNHYYMDFSASAGWEGTQDFSKKQLTYGAQLMLSAKSYANKNILSQLNFPDYPFALIRFLTGTDATIEPYGAALPIITLGIDIVKPTDDKERMEILRNEDQFTRFRFETGFRTLVASIQDVSLYFNAAYRFFKEFNAPLLIKQARLNQFSYFTCSLSGADTYFVSYSRGKLPFDRSDNAIYEIGFKLNL